jgi:putative toxin-antitoxin system antitoxin component (TIGR02293 family)
MSENQNFNEPTAVYGLIQAHDTYTLINLVRNGIVFSYFNQLIKKIPFTMSEWSRFLHVSERTLQRYEKENKTFDTSQSEKIIQIELLFNKGIEVFQDKPNFITWLNSNSIALGTKPKDLLDNAFGIQLLNEELVRIEHGILA